MFVYTFHCLSHCLGIILIPYSNPLFWFWILTHFLWHRYATDIKPIRYDRYNWKLLTTEHGKSGINALFINGRGLLFFRQTHDMVFNGGKWKIQNLCWSRVLKWLFLLHLDHHHHFGKIKTLAQQTLSPYIKRCSWESANQHTCTHTQTDWTYSSAVKPQRYRVGPVWASACQQSHDCPDHHVRTWNWVEVLTLTIWRHVTLRPNVMVSLDKNTLDKNTVKEGTAQRQRSGVFIML